MPKLPKSGTKPRAKTKSKAASNSKSSGNSSKTQKKPRRKPRVVESDPAVGFQRPPVDKAADHAPAGPKALTEEQRVLLGDLFAVVEEHSSDAAEKVQRKLVQKAFVFACERHADQRRASGDDFIVHPVGVAKICAGMRLDTGTLCASLLHDTVEDTSASLQEVQAEFGDEIASLVDGVTKLSGVTFQSRDDRQAENYRKMMVAMAQDIRVILIKLADRLHNMRTLGALPKQKQQEIAEGDARDLRAARAPARHPRDQVGARGPRPSPRCIRGNTRRSRASSASSARSARRSWRGRARSWTRSSARWGSTRRSRAAPSTSTRSIRR